MILKHDVNFKPAPEGVNNAVCVDVVDLGMVETAWGKKQKLRLVWEVEAKQEDGKPFRVVQSYGASVGPKATLRKHLKGWRGRDFTPEELKGFDIEKIIGVPCQLVVVHNESDDGRVFANVETILKPNGTKLAPSSDYVRVKDRTEDQKVKSSGGMPGAPDFEPDESIPF
jgi:hypothetical protein